MCRVLGHTNPSMVVTRLDADEKDALSVADPTGRLQKTTIVSESGLYAVVLLSSKPEAKRFKKWVTSEVLPSIRKTGSYGTPAAIDYNDPKILLGVMQKLQADVEARDKQIAADAPKVQFVDRHAIGEGCERLQAALRTSR